MSNSLAIAAVTATLRNLIAQGSTEELGSGSVTTRPPDKARENGDSGNQINLFLYQTLPNAAWSNTSMPKRVRPGETGPLPLALNLYYLVTAYSQGNDDVIGHRLLGQAMRILHDHTLLNPLDIQTALADSDLHNQIERVRITPQPLSLEDLSKLWTTFQTQYRISAAYEVSVVLIDSQRPIRTPLPVLTRGTSDRGVLAQASLTPPFPTLESLQLPNQQPSLRLGEPLVLRGNHLDSEPEPVVRFRHPRLAAPIELAAQPNSTATALTVILPDQATDWPAGAYTVSVQVRQDGRIQTTNALPFTLAPEILPAPVLGPEQLTLTCRPQIWPEQQVVLLLGERELRPQVDPDAPVTTQKLEQLRFDRRSVPRGEYWLRLRVDGVDSLLVDRSVSPPVFDPAQKVVLP
ncbi:Pvc16 family protein [Leptolyngbya sp. FACHB-261]|uniref:Pvc16 family protein n=1 Tax=Leptolyngbya sp. FACHB-261 TaxID=2692806 RepID=UPI001683EEB5|nr:Pvc16 family protein [Leptolyngbya sp. FACHB-261]MBD2102591.1 DUF4255 domain-containing protein [Leptolyngbya sp. FACHB-261]